MAMSPVVQVKGLGFHFDTRAVFDRFVVTLEPGLTWVRGANGAGKTTLLKLLAGALTPNRGRICLDGIDSAEAPLAYRLNCFYCGGETPDLPWLTAQEFLDLHVALYPATDVVLLNRELAAFAILDALPQAVTTLSLGQHKKLQLALGLALPVRLLLIDEPFNGLDAAAVEYLRMQLRQRTARGDTCIVLTSHLDPGVPVTRTLDL